MTVPDDSTTPTPDEVPAPVHLPTEPGALPDASADDEPDPVVATEPEADDDVDPDHRDEDVLPHVPPGSMAGGPS